MQRRPSGNIEFSIVIEEYRAGEKKNDTMRSNEVGRTNFLRADDLSISNDYLAELSCDTNDKLSCQLDVASSI